MPADDQYDLVHDRVKIKADDPYGCHSRTGMSNGYWVMERTYWPDGRFSVSLSFIPYRNSTMCRNFYLWDVDPRCGGCTTERDIEYAERMKGMK